MYQLYLWNDRSCTSYIYEMIDRLPAIYLWNDRSCTSYIYEEIDRVPVLFMKWSMVYQLYLWNENIYHQKMARTKRINKRHILYVVGKKLQEKKAKKASLTQATMSFDTPCGVIPWDRPNPRIRDTYNISNQGHFLTVKSHGQEYTIWQRQSNFGFDREAMVRAQ